MITGVSFRTGGVIDVTCMDTQVLLIETVGSYDSNQIKEYPKGLIEMHVTIRGTLEAAASRPRLIELKIEKDVPVCFERRNLPLSRVTTPVVIRDGPGSPWNPSRSYVNSGF